MGLGLGLGLRLGRLGRATLLDLLTTHVGREGPGVADMVQPNPNPSPNTNPNPNQVTLEAINSHSYAATLAGYTYEVSVH